MNEKNLDEIAYRRQAFKLVDKGKSAHQILRLIPRSRSWLFKWKRWFDEHGWSALDSLSKAPTHSPHAYEPSVVNLVLRVRARLARAKVGLVGARGVLGVEKEAAGERRPVDFHHQTLVAKSRLFPTSNSSYSRLLSGTSVAG